MRREQEVERRKMLRTETKRLLWTAGSWFAAQYCVTTTRSIVRPDQTAAVLMQRPCNLPVAVSLHCVPKNETRIIARTMLSQDVCLSVCPSHAGILSKRLNLSSHLFHRRPSCSHTILVFFQIKCYCNIPTGTPNGGVECKDYEKSLFSTNISLYLRNDTRYKKWYKSEP